ncbi:MAG: hypothetical protein LBR44_11860 [Clostridiales Family XIII bacterium]|jgi:DNA-binding CsgD family transcriptional regulator/phage FluMu protein Com|nr:hypothetical protein [Clostridiales Family XIII bacterium]
MPRRRTQAAEYAVRAYLRGYQNTRWVANKLGDTRLLDEYKSFQKKVRADLDSGEKDIDAYLGTLNGWLTAHRVSPVGIGDARAKSPAVKVGDSVLGRTVIGEAEPINGQKAWLVRCNQCGFEHPASWSILRLECPRCKEMERIRKEARVAEYKQFMEGKLEAVAQMRGRAKPRRGENPCKEALDSVMEKTGRSQDSVMEEFRKAVTEGRYFVFTSRAILGKSIPDLQKETGKARQGLYFSESKAAAYFKSLFENPVKEAVLAIAGKEGVAPEDALASLLPTLTEREKACLSLRFEGKPYYEVGEAIGSTPRVVIELERAAIEKLGLPTEGMVGVRPERVAAEGGGQGEHVWSRDFMDEILGEDPDEAERKRILSIVKKELGRSARLHKINRYKIFTMRLKGKSFHDISKALGIPAGNVSAYERNIYKRLKYLQIVEPETFRA